MSSGDDASAGSGARAAPCRRLGSPACRAPAGTRGGPVPRLPWRCRWRDRTPACRTCAGRRARRSRAPGWARGGQPWSPGSRAGLRVPPAMRRRNADRASAFTDSERRIAPFPGARWPTLRTPAAPTSRDEIRRSRNGRRAPHHGLGRLDRVLDGGHEHIGRGVLARRGAVPAVSARPEEAVVTHRRRLVPRGAPPLRGPARMALLHRSPRPADGGRGRAALRGEGRTHGFARRPGRPSRAGRPDARGVLNRRAWVAKGGACPRVAPGGRRGAT